MRKDLLRRQGHFYKANLHAHSNLSDGCLTPAEMKAAYRARGYSILCVTDHEILLDHSDLTDEDFLLLTGYEMAFNEDAPGRPFDLKRTCHINLYAREAANTNQVCFDPDEVWGNARAELPHLRRAGEIYRRAYSVESVNHVIAEARAHGFLVQYNHPAWSLETPDYFLNYRGAFAMEISNYGCVTSGIEEYNDAVYDMMLRSGRRIYCTCTDDNHNHAPLTAPNSDSFGGFTVIQAESLTYPSVIAALERGDFYASTGPEIYEVYQEDGELHIACSPARSIQMSSYGRRSARSIESDGVTRAAFALNGSEGYVRLTVTGLDGRKAYTRAYFADELGLEVPAAFGGEPIFFSGRDI